MDPRIEGKLKSSKRKQPDEDEVLEKDELLSEQPIENEYEHIDDDDDDLEDEDEDEETLNQKKEEYKRMLEAQEPATFTQYDTIKITPFNLQEELEDGEFDGTGNFIFKKEKTDDENYDTWAESVDWEAVEQKARKKEEKDMQLSSNDTHLDEAIPPQKDKVTCYKTMLRIMQPDESVQKAIKRLGNAIPKRKPGKHKSRESTSSTTPHEDLSVAEIRKNLNTVIELAHQLLEEGDMDIYQKSYEDLEEAIN